jgi:hypothetical protein
MTLEPEQIGELIFVPNSNYPYPLPLEQPPHHWMTEQSGKLEAAVEAYFNGEALAPAEMTLIKLYLRQYLERAVLTGDANRARLLQRIDDLRTTRDVERFADDIAEYGVEPF